MRFCAICADDVEHPRMRPLGRNDALVAVCPSCDEDPAVTRYGPERGFVPNGGLPRAGEATEGMHRARGADDERLTKRDRELFLAFPPQKSQEELDIMAVVHEGLRRRRTDAYRIQHKADRAVQVRKVKRK